MRNLLVITLFLIGLSASGQSVEGLWYNKGLNYFVQLDGDNCKMTDKWYRENDTIGYFRNDHEFEFKTEVDKIKLKNVYFSGGLIFWKRSDKCSYLIVELTDSTLVLQPFESNAKNQSGILESINESGVLTFRRESADFYNNLTGIELEKSHNIR